MDEEIEDPQVRHIPGTIAGVLIVLSIVTRTAIDVLQKLWIGTFTDVSDASNHTICNATKEYGQIDPFFALLISDFLITIFLGVVLLLISCPCLQLITKHETSYDKTQFALIGASDTVAVLLFVYASNGCRTPPYLQAVVLNLTIPVVFILRFIALKKRPTCRKLLCALLVVFAEFTLLIPVLFPTLDSESIFPDSEELYGHPNPLWVLCFFFGIIPMALSSIYSEKTVKVFFPHRNQPTYMNCLYFLFWSYLFSLLTVLFLFWSDCIPGFGMYNNIPQFGEEMWFNVKCFFGYEGCTGAVNIVSGVCVFLVFINRITNIYILRYLEGANYLALLSSLPTPLLYIFLTLFDKNPVRWHPHAYISTWLSVAALCIMIPAIYIYHTGVPEIIPPKEPLVYCIDNGMQTVGHNPRTNGQRLCNSYVQCNNLDDTDETSRLLIDSEPPPYRVLYNAFQERGVTTHSVGVGSNMSATENLDHLAGGDHTPFVAEPKHEDISTDTDGDVVLEEECHDRLVQANDFEVDGVDQNDENPLEVNSNAMAFSVTGCNDKDPVYESGNHELNDDFYVEDLVPVTDTNDTTQLLANIPVIVCSPSSNDGFINSFED